MSDHTPQQDEIPYGYCHCGCGQRTNIIKANNYARGDVKGEYCRYVAGHQMRGRRQDEKWVEKRISHQVGKTRSEETKRKISENHKAKGIQPSREATAKSNENRGKREQNPSWRGGISMVNGYRCVYQPDHPSALPNGYIYEHRAVMEQLLGRFLEPEEVVHHVDGDKLNNSPENLELLPSQSVHARLHQERGDID
jgi:hypothetical protein